MKSARSRIKKTKKSRSGHIRAFFGPIFFVFRRFSFNFIKHTAIRKVQVRLFRGDVRSGSEISAPAPTDKLPAPCFLCRFQVAGVRARDLIRFEMRLSGLLCCAVLVVSCARTESVPVPDCSSCNYVKKTKGNKTLWGVECDGAMIVPVEYDRMDRLPEIASFVAYKGADRHIYVFYPQRKICRLDDLRGAVYKGYTKLSARSELLHEQLFYRELFRDGSPYELYRIFGADGKDYFMYWTRQTMYGSRSYAPAVFGPFEDFFATRSGYAFKVQGKWGFRAFEKKPGDYMFSERELLPPECDALFEVVCRVGYGKWESYFLYRKSGKWSLVDRDGVPGYIAGYSIPELSGMPITDAERANRRGAYYVTTFRVGTGERGAIYIDPGRK